MTNSNFNAKRALLATRLIYFSLIFGILFFLILIFYITKGQLFFKADFTNPLFPALLILSCITIPGGYLYSKRQISKLDPLLSLDAKYPVYQSGLLIRLSTCQGMSLFSIVCLLLTDNLFSMVFLLISIIIFFLYFPTPDKIGAELRLKDWETELFY